MKRLRNPLQVERNWGAIMFFAWELLLFVSFATMVLGYLQVSGAWYPLTFGVVCVILWLWKRYETGRRGTTAAFREEVSPAHSEDQEHPMAAPSHGDSNTGEP